MMGAQALDVWTVYKNPVDYPDKYVARRFLVASGGMKATREMFVEDSLAQVRALLPANYTYLARDPKDDPHIVETWI
jgi:hypothetical protein